MTATAPRVGDPAPDCTRPSTAGADIVLSSFRGKQTGLLACFPLAFTSTCTAEVCVSSEDFDRFAGAHPTVLPINVGAVPTQQELKAKQAIKVELLSAFKRQVSRAYGTSRARAAGAPRNGQQSAAGRRRAAAADRGARRVGWAGMG